VADAFVDTDVIVRLIAKDDPAKAAAAAVLFARVEIGELRAAAPGSVVHDAVYVLGSPRLYALPRAEIRAALGALLGLPGFVVADRAVLLRALDVFVARRRLDFGDAMIVAAMAEAGATELYSYDQGFDRVPGIERRPPG
jgi:predicted nucleic acid-binding protein